VLTEGQTLLVADILIPMVLSGKFAAKMISVVSQLKAQELKVKAYMLVGRVVCVDPGAQPLFSMEL
jgi:hypothetical protein